MHFIPKEILLITGTSSTHNQIENSPSEWPTCRRDPTFQANTIAALLR
jgi:hypothetical protein